MLTHCRNVAVFNFYKDVHLINKEDAKFSKNIFRITFFNQFFIEVYKRLTQSLQSLSIGDRAIEHELNTCSYWNNSPQYYRGNDSLRIEIGVPISDVRGYFWADFNNEKVQTSVKIVNIAISSTKINISISYKRAI